MNMYNVKVVDIALPRRHVICEIVNCQMTLFQDTYSPLNHILLANHYQPIHVTDFFRRANFALPQLTS